MPIVEQKPPVGERGRGRAHAHRCSSFGQELGHHHQRDPLGEAHRQQGQRRGMAGLVGRVAVSGNGPGGNPRQ